MAGDQTLSKAWKKLEQGDLTFAAKLFRLSLAPLDRIPEGRVIAQSLVGLGRIAYLRGDVARALCYAEEALRHDSNSGPARRLMADANLQEQSFAAHHAWRCEAGLFRS